MEKPRVTHSEDVGTIFHRPETALLPPRRCAAGHLAPHYATQNYCVVCNKLSTLDRRPALGQRHRMPRFTSYAEARAHLEHKGGYLLALGAGVYGVTDNVAIVRRLRRAAWMRHCDAVGVWDEVELTAAAGPCSAARQ